MPAHWSVCGDMERRRQRGSYARRVFWHGHMGADMPAHRLILGFLALVASFGCSARAQSPNEPAEGCSAPPQANLVWLVPEERGAAPFLSEGEISRSFMVRGNGEATSI